MGEVKVFLALLAKGGTLVNAFDSGILLWLNKLSQSSQTANQWLEFLSNNDLAKGVLSLTLFWWAWNWKGPPRPGEREDRRRLLFAGLMGALLALFVGRAMQLFLPFRPRPMNHPALGFQLPVGIDQRMGDMSSFPSDHAALFFSLATILSMVWPLLGVLAGLEATVMICLPRAYLGFHYPSDLLVGALIGVLSVVLCTRPRIRDLIAAPAWRFLERYPGLFYAGMFFLTFELATLFDSIREFGSFAVHGKH